MLYVQKQSNDIYITIFHDEEDHIKTHPFHQIDDVAAGLWSEEIPQFSSKSDQDNWHRNVIILMKFSSLAALEVVIMTTSSATSAENFIKMTLAFQW